MRYLYARLWQHVQENSDTKLPYRELGASRARMLEPDGPFSPSNLRTIEGVFSACIARGITWNTRFIQEYKRCFANPADFFYTIDIARQNGLTARDICYTNAYGAATVRKPEYANDFWKALAEPRFISWLTSETSPSFMAVYSIFKDGQIDGHTAFRGFDSLIAYLLTTDYAIAGVVKEPTVEEMGELIFVIAKGAQKGLYHLGLLPRKKKNTLPDCKRAFTKAYNVLNANISAEDQTRMLFSVFMVEHALCKVSRLDLNSYMAIFDYPPPSWVSAYVP